MIRQSSGQYSLGWATEFWPQQATMGRERCRSCSHDSVGAGSGRSSGAEVPARCSAPMAASVDRSGTEYLALCAFPSVTPPGTVAELCGSAAPCRGCAAANGGASGDGAAGSARSRRLDHLSRAALLERGNVSRKQRRLGHRSCAGRVRTRERGLDRRAG